MKPATKRIDITMKELQAYLDQARAVLGEDGYEKLTWALETLDYLTQSVEDRETTIRRLRQMLFGASTEKTNKVVKREAGKAGRDHTEPSQKKKGHGKNGASDYGGAEKIPVAYSSLKPGDCCPDCKEGKVYKLETPAVLIRIRGQAPIGARVYELERFRCNLCSKVFTARAPEGVGEEKYDETSASMIALLKYGRGVPFNRLEGLQKNMGIPLPASTQWEIVRDTADLIKPVYDELIRQAAQGRVLHNDDTTMKVLELIRDGPEETAPEKKEGDLSPERTGVFTSGIVSTGDGRQIALFFTGRKHAGENLTDVLAQRASGLGPPIQMCDALSRNLTKEFEAIVSNCVAHGRRKFVEVATRFPEECRYVLDVLAKVYKNEAIAKQQKMTPEERQRFHDAESGPLMKELEKWFDEQLTEHKVEPNSGLGQAMTYMRTHWGKLTRFLHVPGAPIDNNLCERALKKAILHRKGSLFYKTLHGAHVGDLFMSLIHTCELCDANSFDYLNQLQRHATDLIRSPAKWMPWSYQATVACMISGPNAR